MVDSDTGFYLPNGAMRNPDTAWISNDRLKNLPVEKLNSFPHIVPDFIVELKSKRDRIEDLKLKMQEWMTNGCLLGWLIDADDEVVYIYRYGEEETHFGFDTPLSAEPNLKGFQLNLS